MTLRDPNGVLLNFIQNVRGGIGPGNRFPGIAGRTKTRKPRAGASRARGAAAGRNAPGKKALKPKPRKATKPRSDASRGRRSG
jgi:hypothetical protein